MKTDDLPDLRRADGVELAPGDVALRAVQDRAVDPMTSTVPDLPVPDEARRAFADQHGLTPPGSAGRRVDWDAVDRDIRAIAAPMIAAELRRLAQTLPWSEATDPLLNRADELDPEETP